MNSQTDNAPSDDAPATPRRCIRNFLAGERAAQCEFLAQLVRMLSDNPPGDCAPHAEYVAGLLEQLGFVVERHVVPATLVKANGMVSCTNLIVRERFGAGGPVIALNAHGDVVPPGAGWSADPYGAEIRKGYMYGRGAAVSKSDFATYTWALMALKQSGASLAGCVELHLTYDEEVGGALGPKWLLEQKIVQPDYAISAGFSYAVTTAHNGCLHLEVEVLGRSGHAAEPEKGDDALEAAATLLNDLYAYRKALTAMRSSFPGIAYPTLVVGLISGGTNTNVVPDRIVFRLDRRITPEETPSAAEKSITALIAESARKLPGIRVNVRRIMLANPFVPRPGHERLVQALQRSAREVLGFAIEPRSTPMYTDARHYGEAGVPTVSYGAGPRTLEEASGHRADEKLKLTDLYQATEIVALALHDLLGGNSAVD